MSSRKSRSKDDTWTTEELAGALKTNKTDESKRHRSSNDKKRRGDDERRHRKDDVDERRTNLDDEERERQRQERRERRERKDKSKSRDDKQPSSSRTRGEKINSNYGEEKTERKDRQRTRDREDKYDDKDEERKERREKVRSKTDKNSERDPERKERREKTRSKDDKDDGRRHHSDKSKRREERHSGKDDKSIYEEEKKHRRKTRENDEDRKDRHGRDKGNRDSETRAKKEEHINGRDNFEKEKEIKTKSDKKKEQSENEEEDYNYDDDFENYDDDFEDDNEQDDSDDNEHIKSSPKDKEMNDILRALNEENAALTPTSAGSRRSNHTDHSDEAAEAPYIPKETRQKTFINFVSAKQRAVDQKVSSKTKKRYKDLMSLIEFDKAEFVMFDLPPVKEYDLYIRSFGRSDTKQAYIQTNDDDMERETQTEEIENKNKWTQHPAEDFYGCGGDDDKEPTINARPEYTSKHQTDQIAKFVSKAAQVMCILLDEESGVSSNNGVTGHKSDLSVSSGYVTLGTTTILRGRYVESAIFSSSQPNILLTSFSRPELIENAIYDTKGLLCTWNVLEPSNPQKILACESQPTCCCLSPQKPVLACAGMVDGSVVVWDLREPASMHHPIQVLQEEYTFRYPTYNTAGVSENENHLSPVSTLLPVYPDPTSTKYSEENSDDASGLSFQLASCEENGSFNLWVVAEIPTPDQAGSEIDLGLQPGGRIKLVKSSSFKIKVPSLTEHVQHTRAYEFQFSPSDLNQYYVGTDIGVLLHGVRLGTCGFPRSHSTAIDRPVHVKSIDLSPFGHPYILAGCSDGCLYLYFTGAEHPLISWSDLATGKSNSISFVRWSRSRPGVFFVLDNLSMIYTFDLLEGDSRPVQSEQLNAGNVVSMVLSNDSNIISSGSIDRPPQLLFAFDNGTTEIHNINKNLVQPQTLEHEFLTKYHERF